ncbi:phosphate ABC transporter ATP-binding protein PstB [Spirochaeta africana]|uniref:Phosphate ABC transporter, ATP-binding protein n=1 Tax=Spirochaeta africana (strain ATCC 700263 / DSM 8902 / Z-7692) TaxID=889378 RepID=H9UGT8_SPIAZ|nr:phosphate ABC transporter ATP-binding protein PstB [Spirochaeta africana]AFG36731.1 phosphate ABC transporter, ATP-binding protein [Spirochaeta africana DSM 8902]
MATSKTTAEPQIRMETDKLSVVYNKTTYGVREVSMPVYTNQVTALIGPSGCGKTTYLRALNRMHDLSPEAEVLGHAFLDGDDIYAPNVDPVVVRRKIGMVFQKPTPFPTKSIYDNVAAGLTLVGMRRNAELDGIVEQSLRGAALWDEVKDRLKSPGGSLSGGQQQRLSIARALAVNPEVILMDEPTSSLDPASTLRIEELIQSLKEQVSIVIVTHNMQQAQRVADYTAFFFVGEVVEFAPTRQLFDSPKEEKTEEYLSGAFS